MQTIKTDIEHLVTLKRYSDASALLNTSDELSPSEKKELKHTINTSHLCHDKLEWTNHGITKTFRYWTLAEKKQYIRAAAKLVQTLKNFSPNVCMGFGSVLGFIRENDFIAHDDDLDVIITLKPSRFENIKSALSIFLKRSGYETYDSNLSHLTAWIENEQPAGIDVFIAFKEDEFLSCYPSRRKGLLYNDVFPTTARSCYEVNLPFPADSTTYLQNVYGPDWQNPISNWNHPWDREEYSEFL
jgi:hypothetical protein